MKVIQLDKNVKSNIKRINIYNEIKKTKGRFFYVEFIKQDKTLRKLTGRISVKNYFKKTDKKIKVKHPIASGFIRVYDTGIKQYRNVNLDTIKKLHINKNQLRWQ
jgi:hypothetical protein|tara:strand:- start:10831 stop:11145 length:315 start_codon:yes stop_codon:yes gene_type:complete